MQQDKAKLGERYTCFQCGCKFYDLNRPEPTCPECEADQRQAPVQDIKALLSSGKRARADKKKAEAAEAAAAAAAAKATKASEDEDDDGLLGGFDSADDDEVDVDEEE